MKENKNVKLEKYKAKNKQQLYLKVIINEADICIINDIFHKILNIYTWTVFIFDIIFTERVILKIIVLLHDI